MQINTKEGKEHLCEIAIENTKKLAQALEDIKNGESENTVCHKYNITKSYIRYFIFKNNKIFNGGISTNEDEEDFDKEILLSGGEKLYKKLDPGRSIPYDVDEVVEFFLKNANLRNSELKVLRMRYWEDMTLEDTGKKMSLTRERIRQIECRAMRRIRTKFRDIIKYGNAPFIKQRNERLERYIKEKEDEIAKYNKLIQEAQKIDEEIEILKEKNKKYLENRQSEETVGEFLEYCLKNENVSIRLYNCFFRRKDCSSFEWKSDRPIKDMANYTRNEIMRQVRNMGVRSSMELEHLLSKRGIYFKEEG